MRNSLSNSSEQQRLASLYFNRAWKVWWEVWKVKYVKLFCADKHNKFKVGIKI